MSYLHEHHSNRASVCIPLRTPDLQYLQREHDPSPRQSMPFVQTAEGGIHHGDCRTTSRTRGFASDACPAFQNQSCARTRRADSDGKAHVLRKAHVRRHDHVLHVRSRSKSVAPSHDERTAQQLGSDERGASPFEGDGHDAHSTAASESRNPDLE